MVEPSPPGWAPRRLTQTPHGDAAQDVVRVWVGPHRRTQDLRAVGPGRIIHIACAVTTASLSLRSYLAQRATTSSTPGLELHPESGSGSSSSRISHHKLIDPEQQDPGSGSSGWGGGSRTLAVSPVPPPTFISSGIACD